MTRENYLKNLIKSKGYTLKEFASTIGIPYSTLLSMLNNSIGGAAVDNVIKICAALGITVEQLQNVKNYNYYEHPKNVVSTNLNSTFARFIKKLVIDTKDNKLEWFQNTVQLKWNTPVSLGLESQNCGVECLNSEVYSVNHKSMEYYIFKIMDMVGEKEKVILVFYNSAIKKHYVMSSDIYSDLFDLFDQAKNCWDNESDDEKWIREYINEELNTYIALDGSIADGGDYPRKKK